jgi:hypothetical protein
MSADAIRAALIRILWRSVADDAECTCCPGDPCPECQAMEALGLGRWIGARDAEATLAFDRTQRERAAGQGLAGGMSKRRRR